METIKNDEKLTFEKVWQLIQETNKQMKETDRRLDEKFNETNMQMKETDRLIKETDKQMKETDKKIEELGKQIGGLGNKFGSFTEAMAFPSIKLIMEKQFKITNIIRNAYARQGEECLEIDILGYSNGKLNTAYVIEVKSHLHESHIKQTLKILKKLKKMFPEHKDKKLFGMIAAVVYSETQKQHVLKSGLYFAQIHDDIFQLDTPQNFKPREF